MKRRSKSKVKSAIPQRLVNTAEMIAMDVVHKICRSVHGKRTEKTKEEMIHEAEMMRMISIAIFSSTFVSLVNELGQEVAERWARMSLQDLSNAISSGSKEFCKQQIRVAFMMNVD